MKLIVLSVSCTCLALHIHEVLAGTHLRRQPLSQDSKKSLHPKRRNRRLPHSKGGPPDDDPFPPLPIFELPLDTLSPTTSPPNTPLPTVSSVLEQGASTPLPTASLPSPEPVEPAETSPPTPLPTPPPTLFPTAQIVTDAPIPDATAAPTASAVQPQPAPPTPDNIFIPGDTASSGSAAPQDDPACQAAMKGEVYATGRSLIIELSYELLTKAGTPLTFIAGTLDGSFQDYVAIQLVNCTLGAASDVQGVAVSSQSTVVDRNCRYISGFNATSFYCFVMKGALKVYTSENTTTAANKIRSSVLSTLKTGMNGPDSRGRNLQDSKSIFVDEEKGIMDLYLLNGDSSSSVSQANGQTTQSSQKVISSGASATLIGIFLATFAAIALVFIRGRKHRGGRSYAQKLTVIADGNSYQEDSDTYGSPREHSYSSRSKLPEHFVDGIETIDPPTPSQLSCPMSSSVSDGLPSVSLFEAYEATPAEQGDLISYNIIHLKRPSKRTVQTQKVLPLDQMRSRSILNISDELLEESPPFMSTIPRSTSRNTERTPKSSRSNRSTDAPTLFDRRISPRMTHSRPDPPRVIDPPESASDTSDEYEGRGIIKFDQSLSDSFSVKAFLNGHCAAMESFYGSMKSEEDSIDALVTKTSPTSVTSLWSDPKTMAKNYKSSVNVWISQCSEATNDDDVEPWTISAKKHIKSFSPYGNNTGQPSSQTPNTKSPSNRRFSECSPDRGRSPTPILDSTNSRRSRSRTKTPTRSERNPPGHRINSAFCQPVIDMSTIQSSSSLRRSSSKSKSPYPRYVTSTSLRGSTSYPEFTSDTVEL